MTRHGASYEPRVRTRKLTGALFGSACFLATLAGVVMLAILLGAIIYEALRFPPDRPWWNVAGQVRELFAFLVSLTQKFSRLDPHKGGFRAGIAGSLWLVGLVALFAIPVGVGAAVYLEEFAVSGRIKAIVQMNIANLAGVPSIVYGLLGSAAFVYAFGVQGLALGPSLWAGGLTLALLVLPVIVVATSEALRAVPSSLRQGALALGATRWEVVRDHVLPSALPGIMTGAILALSRAIGETAPLLMVGAVTSSLRVPAGPSRRYTALPVEIYAYAKDFNPASSSVAAGGILILLVLLLSMNGVAIVIRNRYARIARA
ncbi:MAG: phosphate ABC transporter permease PstA [Isosphaeraceae bacterium]